MSEEGGGKLRLKPRKAPPGRSREPSPGREPPARRQTLANRYSWFEQQGLSESENMWMLILKAVNPDLKPTSWETVPSLPEFFGQNSENEKNPPKPEVFKVGMKDFQWIPLPSFYKEKALNRKNPSCCHISKSQTEHLMEREDQADQNQLNIAPVVEKISLAVNDNPDEIIRMKHSRKSSSKLKEKESTEKYELNQFTDSILHSVPASTQSLAKDFCLQQLCKGTVLSEEKNRKENESKGQQSYAQMYQHNVLLGETRSTSAEIKSPVDISKMEGLEEKAEDQRAGTLTLDSCPMCLIQFTGILSQLDIDSHLAKCLSESADDVIW
ncbi:Fanconi anemia core complex-associated protein 20 isoform X2 [Malaclemys terrapin pileata]|uniref:Fanconi anemia core complex-associated protein 20 isoform X2 n=1 Tax=Malaclemys terrapin pileata TaxID=2991368 RepID=UPI0023A8F564|nr:Fanconi anemia core complex-associated protein 20 isoform X2 [Malaclemys terrapin pileata]